MSIADSDFALRPVAGGSAAGGAAGDAPRQTGQIWLDGDVLACACPECLAPMLVRLWLRVADCWRCGTCVELTEEQERQARELLARQKGQRDR